MLIERHKSGVEVIVFSSNVKQDAYYAQAIHELKLGGIKHQTFSGRHDKFAIIDSEIVYLGPLKPISGKFGVFYGHGGNRECNHSENIPESIFRNILDLSTIRCEKCGGQTVLHVSKKNAWMSCAAPDACNFGQKIKIDVDR